MDAAAPLHSLEVDLQDRCLAIISSRFLYCQCWLRCCCCRHGHHHNNLFLWRENSEETQGQIITSICILPLSILYALICLSQTLFTCGKASCHVNLPTLCCSPYHFTTWRQLSEPKLKLVDPFGTKSSASYEQLQLLSCRLCMWSETEPGAE